MNKAQFKQGMARLAELAGRADALTAELGSVLLELKAQANEFGANEALAPELSEEGNHEWRGLRRRLSPQLVTAMRYGGLASGTSMTPQSRRWFNETVLGKDGHVGLPERAPVAEQEQEVSEPANSPE